MLIRILFLFVVLTSYTNYGQNLTKLDKKYHVEIQFGHAQIMDTDLSSTKGNVYNFVSSNGGMRAFTTTINRKISNYTVGLGIGTIASLNYPTQSIPVILQAKYWIPSSSRFYVGLEYGHGVEIGSIQASSVKSGELNIGKLFLLGKVNLLAELNVKRSSFIRYNKNHLTYKFTSLGISLGVLL